MTKMDMLYKEISTVILQDMMNRAILLLLILIIKKLGNLIIKDFKQYKIGKEGLILKIKEEEKLQIYNKVIIKNMMKKEIKYGLMDKDIRLKLISMEILSDMTNLEIQ